MYAVSERKYAVSERMVRSSPAKAPNADELICRNMNAANLEKKLRADGYALVRLDAPIGDSVLMSECFNARARGCPLSRLFAPEGSCVTAELCFQPERAVENYAPLAHCARNTSRDLSDSTMPDETSEPKSTETRRAGTVRDLKPKTDPKGGASNGGKSDKTLPRTEEVDFNL